MKRLIRFFVRMWKWFISLFTSPSEPEPEKTVPDSSKKNVPLTEKSIGERKYPIHNNRKNTKGRLIQYIKVGKTSKPIFHGAK